MSPRLIIVGGIAAALPIVVAIMALKIGVDASQLCAHCNANGCHRKATIEVKGSCSCIAIAVSLFVGLGLSANAAAQGVAAPKVSSCSSHFVNKANAMLESYLAKSKAPGVAVAFFDNGNACVLVSGVSSVKGGSTYGPVTPKTAFAMGSVQKVFHSTLLAYEIAQGKATIDDSAAKYLVSANGSKVSPGSAFSRITLRNLATHTSSLSRGPSAQEAKEAGWNLYRDPGWTLYHDQPMPPSVTAFLNFWQPPYPPGTRYSYSNIGFVLLAYAATTRANKPYTKLLSEAVTGPIGMARTTPAICDSPNPLCASGHNAEGQPAAAPPAGLWSTADDMLLFIEANLGVLKLPDLQVRAINVAHQELFRENQNHAVGMAWEEWHSGDALLLSKDGLVTGFTAWLAIEPNRHRGVAVLSNGTGTPAPASLGQKLLTLAHTAYSEICDRITVACEQGGFAYGRQKSGIGLEVDCIRPIMEGTSQPPQASRPLPQIDPQVVTACKASNPSFGH
jgi:beta-lactamase class C